MIIGGAEGNLLGEIVIKLCQKVIHADYHVKFEIRDESMNYYEIKPNFPVLQHEDCVVFITTEELAVPYMRVTVTKEEYKHNYHNIADESHCNECATLNLGWKR
mgnify:CR=1 FL=1